MKLKVAVEIISFLFMSLFLYAAFSKLLDYQKFSAQIGQSPLLTGFGNTIPWLVIGSEILVSLMMAIRRFRLAALFIALCLMVMFTAYIIAIINFSSYVPCSCGGVLEKMGWREHVVFNAAFIFLSLIGVLLQFKIQESNNLGSPNQI